MSLPATQSTSARSWQRGLLWSAQALLALAFLAAGGAKLAGVPEIVGLFDRIGWGQWLRFVTAAVEITGAILLLVPRAAWVGAGLLLCTMIGALIVNLTRGEHPAGALALGALALLVLWARRPGTA